jgi:hypothetical protein
MNNQVNTEMPTGKDSNRALPARGNRFVNDDFGGFYAPLGLEPMTVPVQEIDQIDTRRSDELVINY